MRAVSTVLDVTVCLLLIGAAIATLTVPGPEPPASAADETAEGLATTTANVSERVATAGGGRIDREVHGTTAELLARATLANLTLDGHDLAPTAGAFRAAVREQVRRDLAWAPRGTAVTARWMPYPGAPIRGRMTVGPRPPSDVTIGTARVRVPVPVGVEGEASTFRGLARELSESLVAVSLPGEEARGSSRLGPRERRRIEAYADALGIGARSPADLDRDRIERALADRLAADMRGRFRTPAAAAAAVEAGRVTIVVREWSA